MNNLENIFVKNLILNEMRVSRCKGNYTEVIEIYDSRGVLFQDDIWIADEYAISLYYTNRFREAYDVYERIISRSRNLEINDLKHLASNQWFSVLRLNQISDEMSNQILDDQKNKNISDESREIKFSKHNLVTLTMTTCKRLDLFIRTVDSLISKCEDIDRISKWIVVDDGSSHEDIETMRSRYPFIEFIVKHHEQKGHAKSMNMILDTINTPFVFHVEDDWEFVYKRPYITECLDVLASSNILGQCLVNMNYAETGNDFKIHGGTVKKTLGGANYVEHTYTPCIEGGDGGSGCTYWPHFSLRPGVSRVGALRRVGRFNEQVPAFEREYAHRYMRMGCRTAFLPNINSVHIGRLTSQRHVGLRNAYDLNDQIQFADVFCRVINLKRRSDRKRKFETNILPKISFLNPEFYTAVDALDLESLTESQEKMFANNNFGWRRTLIACSLSHLGVITEFLATSCNLCVIFEDDVLDVSDTIAHCINLISTSDYDIIYLGHHFWCDDTDKSISSGTSIVRMNATESLKLSIGGCFAYVLSRKGGERFLKYISKNGVKYGIDTVQQHSADELVVGYAEPMCVTSECCRQNVYVDSDIQYDFEPVRHSNI